MNNSDSLIHLTKFCQAQAETHGLWAELPHLKATWAGCLNGKLTVPALKVGEGRNDQLAARIRYVIFLRASSS